MISLPESFDQNTFLGYCRSKQETELTKKNNKIKILGIHKLLALLILEKEFFVIKAYNILNNDD